ncbi:MAG: protein nirF [Alphaproteobacteria bacterium]|jgi:protein NirF|nr:protein nirF [Alphaproteobacteria bacterium]MBT4084776.1 protein nirF [Alphaproteobacteria bacterium]MBT4544732.1 protein nirF [Alphaproteobacteria bacterium]MBT7745890.1 protein nirF [Alphaproteobacteria bacterium]
MKLKISIAAIALLMLSACAEIRGTGDLGLIIERGAGSIQIVQTTDRESLATIEGLGDLSHASAVYSRDERYAYIFGRDGGLTKIDMLTHKIVARTMQAGNSIGGAISQDGKLVAVSNYKPGGVRIFDAQTLEPVAEIPAIGANGERSKTVGLVDAPGQRFVFSLYDAGETWIVDMRDRNNPAITKLRNIGKLPYDALITPDGRWYIAGLFGEDGMAMVDLWQPEKGVRRILDGYGRGEKALPVYKMPHLEGWAMANGHAFMPAIGHHEVLVAAEGSWKEVDRIAVHGQPVFVMARPDGRQIWVNFAFPDNDTIQVIDVPTRKIIKTLKPGPAVLHMEFTPRGEEVWLSVRDDNQVIMYDTTTFAEKGRLPVRKPSGIFFTARAHRIGL